MLEQKIEDTLLSLGGVAPNLRGFLYLVDAIEIAVNDPDAASHITKRIYPVVAAKHNVTTDRVDRSIRYIIDKVYLQAKVDRLDRTLGNIASSESGKPTNGAFIGAIALKIRRENPVKKGRTT